MVLQMERDLIEPKRKALRINLNKDFPWKIYGSFAEIGAGQEVARYFFQAGAASGTIAKTISAYDMVFSDFLYGQSRDKRYVSEERLNKMLDVEYQSLIDTLASENEHNTCYFAFANTVTTLNFKKDNFAHAWIGIRFQLLPGSESNEIVLHVKMLENDALLQQRTLGILGVNLIFAAFHYYNYPNVFLRSLLDYISNDQIEVDFIRMKGPQLNYVDNRLLAVQLVKNEMTKAVMFDRNGHIQQPHNMLYQKNILVFRGNFRPITYVGFDMLKTGVSMFKKDIDYHKDNTIIFCEMTLNNLLNRGVVDEQDFLNRVDMLCGMGQNVMVSNYPEHYRLISYLSQFKIKKLGMLLGILRINDFFNEEYYYSLKGGILEAMSKFFINNMRLYLYPALRPGTNEIWNSRNLKVPENINFLYKHLVENRKIVDLPDYRKEILGIFAEDVLKMIQENNPRWEKLVPKYVSKKIKGNAMFGYAAEPQTSEST
jgi:hypothetical protein